MEFKRFLSLDEQVEYLKANKHVVFHQISEADAKEILYRCNYTNVVAPFTYLFVKKDKHNVPIIDKNNHYIYEQNIDFYDYYQKYCEEREIYSSLYRALMIFESEFNSIVSHEVLNRFNISNLDDFDSFIYELSKNTWELKTKMSIKNHMLENIPNFKKLLMRYGSLFIFMNRISMGDLITIYKACGPTISNKIFQSMLKRNLTFGYTRKYDFDNILSPLVQIRNCIMHGNSLTILIRYYNLKENILRNKSDMKRYYALIEKLLQENEP